LIRALTISAACAIALSGCTEKLGLEHLRFKCSKQTDCQHNETCENNECKPKPPPGGPPDAGTPDTQTVVDTAPDTSEPPIDTADTASVCADECPGAECAVGFCHPVLGCTLLADEPEGCCPGHRALEFDSGSSGVLLEPADTGPAWAWTGDGPNNVTSGAMYYGDADSFSYAPGPAVSQSFKMAHKLPPDGMALTFLAYIDIPAGDTLVLQREATDTAELLTLKAGDADDWTLFSVQVDGVGGTEPTDIDLHWRMVTTSDAGGTHEGVYVDNISLTPSCSGPPPGE